MGTTRRPPREPAYRAAYECMQALRAAGFKRITRRGWPTFACEGGDGQLILVIVKRKAHYRARVSQKKLCAQLLRAGVEIRFFVPGHGFRLAGYEDFID